MSSPRRKHGRPIESVELKITFSGDRETNDRIRELIPGAVVRGGVCEVRVEAERPGDVAEVARVMLEKIRTII
jgi:hypothetical protein